MNKFKKILFSLKKDKEKSILISIVITGIVLRLSLAIGNYNLDVANYILDKDIFLKGGNIYTQQVAYNYTPIFYYILGSLGVIQKLLGNIYFPFLVRSFLTGIDFITLIFLLKIAEILKISKIKTAFLFFLNPISIIITGHHGQFDNIAILLLVISLFFYLKGRREKKCFKEHFYLFL